MKLKSLVCLSLIFLLSLHIFSCKKAKQEEEKETEIQKGAFRSEISGRITDENHKGIPGVRLYFYRFPAEEPTGVLKKAPSTITDKDGSYTIKNLQPGQYSIVIETDNFIPPKPKSVTLEADQALKNIDFILTRGFSITGTVTDKESKPLTDARITVFAPPTDEHPDEETIVKETKTDSQGKFVIRGLKPHEYVIEAYKNGYFKHHEPISAPYSSLYIILHTGGIILGKVVDKANNKPLKQYFIHILDTKEQPDGARVIRYDFDTERELVESRDGSFWYAGLKSGTYKLIAYADGYAINILDNISVEKGEKTSGITIELKKGATLTGVVRSEKSGAPIKEAEIYQILKIKEPGVEQLIEENIFITKTDEKGEFKITGINAGEYILAVNHDDFIPKQFEVGIYIEDTSQNIEIFLVPKSSSVK